MYYSCAAIFNGARAFNNKVLQNKLQRSLYLKHYVCVVSKQSTVLMTISHTQIVFTHFSHSSVCWWLLGLRGGGGGVDPGHKLKAWLQLWQENRKLRGRRDGKGWGRWWRGGRGRRDLRPWLKAAVEWVGVKGPILLFFFLNSWKTDLSRATRGSAKTSTLAWRQLKS